MKNKFIYILVLGMIFTMVGYGATAAQDTPFLERVITISFNEEPIHAALKRISQKGGFIFSYNPSILNQDKVISQNFVDKTVREILDQLFNGTVKYKAKGKYIILTKAEISNSGQEPQLYSGYIIDEATGERLKDVSVYDPVTLSSTITDSSGYFEIEIDKPSPDLRLAIYKKHYTDTVVVVPSEKGKLLNISMKFNKEKITNLADSVGKKIKRFFKLPLPPIPRLNIVNIDDTLHRTTQFSFVPFIGTNHSLSGNVINDFSLNFIGGYSLGVDKLELGGVFNLVRGNVQGAQLAGTFNAVGGDVTGAQFAGVFNANRGFMKGAQFAGIFNLNWNGVEYFSAAGVFNFSGHESRAVQLAGVGNITIGEQSSPHFAGLFNFTTSDAKTQFAGVYNFTASNLKGWQAAGVFNFTAKDVMGIQTASVLNFAGKEIRGTQISGFLNYATRVRGSQIGLINVADSVIGVPVGVLSIVLKGYHKIELSADEIFYSNIALRTGVRQFYNIITVGAKPSTFNDDATFWTFGYGVGTAPKLSRKIYLNLDLTSNQVMQGNSIEALNLINKFYVGVDFQVFKKASLTVGGTLNTHIIETTHEGYWDIFTDYSPRIFFDRSYSNDINMKMWWAGKIGIRFL